MTSILDRFTGQHGLKAIIELFRLSPCFGGSAEAATALFSKSTPKIINSGELIIQQGDGANSIFFIVSGSFEVVVDNRVVALRKAGNHVGEMALIDATARRSATVRAREESVIIEIIEPDFSTVAAAYPHMWRALASELADRLRQRNQYVRQRADVPTIFIASSAEALSRARAISSGLHHDKMRVVPWSVSTFTPGEHAMESLESAIERADFGVALLTPDDVTTSRERTKASPRDNALFELGLFVGALGRMRAFAVTPLGVDMKMPSDLYGINSITYNQNENDIDVAMQNTCNEIRKLVGKLGSR